MIGTSRCSCSYVSTVVWTCTSIYVICSVVLNLKYENYVYKSVGELGCSAYQLEGAIDIITPGAEMWGAGQEAGPGLAVEEPAEPQCRSAVKPVHRRICSRRPSTGAVEAGLGVSRATW